MRPPHLGLALALWSFGMSSSWDASAEGCSDMEVLDVSMGMCMPLPMSQMPMQMLMLSGNSFATGIAESGSRGRSTLAAPNMFMADIGSSLGTSQYLNFEYMGTLERWTYPYSGYPELLQIGEANSQGALFIDAQHPHSSPIMGLTLSDTIRFNQESKDFVKFFFAPRGESTDGPVAFMHRATGMVNPDAPLGHHIGQDVGHISSTVLGAELWLGSAALEVSTFNGTEPLPDSVDLPMGPLNSFSFRLTEVFSRSLTAMLSVARVDDSDLGSQNTSRYSASLYNEYELGEDRKFYNSLIFGLITHYDSASTLISFGEEFLFRGGSHSLWGRLEVLQRTPAELEILNISDQNQGRWVEALTVGYTHSLKKWEDVELGLGASVTVDFLPSALSGGYGGSSPFTGKVFLQLGGSKMWSL